MNDKALKIIWRILILISAIYLSIRIVYSIENNLVLQIIAGLMLFFYVVAVELKLLFEEFIK